MPTKTNSIGMSQSKFMNRLQKTWMEQSLSETLSTLCSEPMKFFIIKSHKLNNNSNIPIIPLNGQITKEILINSQMISCSSTKPSICLAPQNLKKTAKLVILMDLPDKVGLLPLKMIVVRQVVYLQKNLLKERNLLL